MAQIANIVLADGQATPANVTFAVQNGQQADEPARWFNRGGSYNAWFKLMQLVRRSATTKATKVTVRLEMPTVATVNGIQVLSHTHAVDITVTCPDVGTPAERDNIRAFAWNYCNSTAFKDAVSGLQPAW